MRKRSSMVMILLLAVGLLLPPTHAQEGNEPFTLTVMHTNDTRATHTPDQNGDGGVARQAAVLNQIRAEVPNSILLDTGDRFMGTLYHTLYLGQDQVQIMNLLGYDAMTLGNHEFDNGDAVLAAFLSEINFPVVVANMDVSQSPLLHDLIVPYTVLERSGQQIGVIGLITDETPQIASPGKEITFSGDYVTIANDIAAELNAQGINKIILLTHLGIDFVRPLMEQWAGIDVVVDGSSHTLLSNIYQGAVDRYPLDYTSASGEPILYVQAGEYTQYLGRLDVEFDADGVITDFGGDSILLSRYITPDPTMQALIDELAKPIENLLSETIGATSEVFLTGDRTVCRVEECNLGDLIADAMRADSGAQIAFMNGGGIRANIDVGEITLGEILVVQPFANLISTFDLKGADVIAALENGVSRLVLGENGRVSRNDAAGRFLQVSGLRYTIDPTQEVGSRIVSVEVQGEDGTFAPIDPDAVYSVVTNNFLRLGGDDFTMLRDNAIEPYDFGRVDYEVTRQYLIDNSPITLQPEGRITYINAEVAP